MNLGRYKVVGEKSPLLFVRSCDGATFIFEREDFEKMFGELKFSIGDKVWILFHLPNTKGQTWCEAEILQFWSGGRILVSMSDDSGTAIVFNDDLFRFPDLKLSAQVQNV
jgi:hypothetical protein